MRFKGWLKQPQFYQVAGLYMSAQLYINISQSFYPFFLEETLHMTSKAVAIIPLLMFLAGLAVSRLSGLLDSVADHRVAFGTACFVGLATCVWINFGSVQTLNEVSGICDMASDPGNTFALSELHDIPTVHIGGSLKSSSVHKQFMLSSPTHWKSRELWSFHIWQHELPRQMLHWACHIFHPRTDPISWWPLGNLLS